MRTHIQIKEKEKVRKWLKGIFNLLRRQQQTSRNRQKNKYQERRQFRRPVCRSEIVPDVKRKIGCVETLRKA